MPTPVAQKDDRLEEKSETAVLQRQIAHVLVYSAEISIGSGRVTFGRLGSRPRPAALSDSSIVYACSFSCFSRRL